MHALMVPRSPLIAHPVVALPESPALFLDYDRLQRRDDLAVSRRPIDAQLVVRRPRQPGYLASSHNRQSVSLDHDPDRLALGRRRQSFRLRTSLIAVFSSARSAYMRLSLAFSASSSRSRLSSLTPAPAYFDFQW